MGVRFASAYAQNTSREARFYMVHILCVLQCSAWVNGFRKGIIRGLNPYPDQSSLIVIIYPYQTGGVILTTLFGATADGL